MYGSILFIKKKKNKKVTFVFIHQHFVCISSAALDMGSGRSSLDLFFLSFTMFSL